MCVGECVYLCIWNLNRLDCGESEQRVHLSHHHQSLEPVAMNKHQIWDQSHKYPDCPLNMWIARNATTTNQDSVWAKHSFSGEVESWKWKTHAKTCMTVMTETDVGSYFANMLLGFGWETFPSLIDKKKGIAIESDFADRRWLCIEQISPNMPACQIQDTNSFFRHKRNSELSHYDMAYRAVISRAQRVPVTWLATRHFFRYPTWPGLYPKMANFGPHNWIIAIIIITIYIFGPAPHGGGAGETRRTEQHHHHHHHHHYHHCLANPPEEAVVRVAKPSASRFRPNLSPSNTWPINHCHFLNRMTVQTLIPNHANVYTGWLYKH